MVWIEQAGQGPWLYLLLFALVVADAFIVVLPSETLVVALGSLALSTGSPNIWLVLPIAAIGAVIGDHLCFLLGRSIGVTRFRWMRHPRVQSAIDRVRGTLHRRAASVILTARYIPFARIAVNLTAGAAGFPYRRYLPLTLVAGVCWAVYNCVIGAVFGAWLSAYPIVAVVVSVLVAIALGIAIDAVIGRLSARKAARLDEAER